MFYERASSTDGEELSRGRDTKMARREGKSKGSSSR